MRNYKELIVFILERTFQGFSGLFGYINIGMIMMSFIFGILKIFIFNENH